MSGTFNPFDIFVLVVLALSTFWGGIRGVVSQLTSIFSWIASAYIATRHYHLVAKFMNASYSYHTPLAMIVTFIISVLLIHLASNFVKNLVSLAGLKEFDRQMGALLGLAKGVVLCLLVTFLLIVVNDSTRVVIEKSNTGPYFASFLLKIQKHLPDSELTNKFMTHVNTIEEKKQEELEEDGTETKSLGTEVRDLKKYLTTKILSDQATDILAEAEEGSEEESDGMTFGSLLQNAATTVNRLKGALSSDSTSAKSKPAGSNVASSTFPTAGGSSSVAPPTYDHNVYDDYEDRYYDDYGDGGYAVPDPLGLGQQSTDRTDVNRDRYASSDPTISQEVSSDQRSESGDFLGGLAAFLSTIGGGFGGYVNDSGSASNSSNYDSTGGSYPYGGDYSPGFSSGARNDGVNYQPSARSDSPGVYNSNASRSRLNSRTYTIDPSSVNF